MENERANRSRGFSHIAVSASISVLVLAGVVAWQLFQPDMVAVAPAATTNSRGGGEFDLERELAAFATKDGKGPAQTGGDALDQLLGSYVAMQQAGTYTDEYGERVAQSIAADLKTEIPYTPIEESAIHTTPDTSYGSVLAYRSALRIALAPLLLNREAEFEVFARYVDTRDKNDLDELSVIAKRYEKAAEQAAIITVPTDAAHYHANVVNALRKFAATLSTMIKYADDSMATLALLRSYNSSEAAVLLSFNSLAQYQKRKMP